MKRVIAYTVFAIIALLLLVVAVTSPDQFFREASKRSPLSRARSDMRSLATGLESYFIDHEVYPAGAPFRDMVPGTASELPRTGEHLLTPPPSLTTPVSYLTHLFPDGFQKGSSRGLGFGYYTDGKGWILFSPGPDLDFDLTDPASVYDSETTQPSPLLIGGAWTYDPTNGVGSSGDVWRVKQ
jgi:hypothetical protein